MKLRRQLPAHSPLSFGALLSGAVGALGRRDYDTLDAAIHAHWPARETALTSSGTAALSLAIQAALTDPQSTVALPAYACYDLATAAVGANARVVLYDLDPETLAPNRDSLLRALAHKPAALVLVHLYGVPVDVQAIARLAASTDTVIIEDAAQGLGAAVRGVPVGGLGSVAVLSFGRGKGLTGGNGGALLANDERGARIVRDVRRRLRDEPSGWSDLVRAAALWLLARPAIFALPAALPFLRLGQTLYHPPAPAAPLARSAASMLTRVWNDALAAIPIRREQGHRLNAAATRSDRWRPIRVASDATAGYLRLPLLAPADARAHLLDEASATLGIMQGYPMPLYQLPGFSERCLNASDAFPGAALLAERLFTLPTHGLLTEHDLKSLELWLEKDSAGRWNQRVAADAAAIGVG